ncbi:MAG: hypothetical protein U9O56_10380 [Campylobacterota bacterium]|nr:hypothetical protein [Campylobacterota bacterium]
MKIEFRKIPLEQSEFEINSDSVKFLGTFSKMSSKLAKIDGILSGKLEVDCCKCGLSYDLSLDESIKLMVSDGIYSSTHEDEEEFVIIEIENHILDFNDILCSEIESLKSEYYSCSTCSNNDNLVEIEY